MISSYILRLLQRSLIPGHEVRYQAGQSLDSFGTKVGILRVQVPKRKVSTQTNSCSSECISPIFLMYQTFGEECCYALVVEQAG